jgi:hypothetical protein
MGGRKSRRPGGQAGRRFARWCIRAAILAGAVLPGYPPTRLSAQVGYPPDRSPYRDVKRGRTLILGAGYLSGGRGVVGVGPSNGGMTSARFEVPFGKPLAFFVGAGYGRLSRFIADPTKDSASHISGPINVDVVVIEGGIHLLLSDSKTWHAFAPVIGASGGVIVARDPPADSSGYRFRAKGMFGPELGMRWYLGRRVALRADARLMFWQLTYPLAYKQPSPDGSRVLQIDPPAPDKEWTRHPWISIGLGWTF